MNIRILVSKGGRSRQTRGFRVSAGPAGKAEGAVRGSHGLAGVLLAAAALLASGCSSTPASSDAVAAQRAAQEREARDDLNRQLASAAIKSAADVDALRREYAVGAGDVLDISVFDIEELNKTVRVNGRGGIILPLLGELQVGGKSTREIEALIAEHLTEYLHDPQVSVFVAEYQSQQISVSGAVNEPELHTVSRPRTVLELLSMSGGLSENAGDQIYVSTRVDGAPQRLIIDLAEVLSNPDNAELTILLSGDDSIYVPEAGVVFVEGAVNEPGAYQLTGGTGVMEAIAMAGGTKFAAREGDVQVLTLADGGKKEVVDVDLDALRANVGPNIELQDGDIVLVPTNSMKAGLAGFWRGISGIFGVGYSVSGP